MSRRYKPLYIEDGSEETMSQDLQAAVKPESTIDPSSTLDNESELLEEDPKIRHWKNSLYAVGLVEPTWADELYSRKKKGEIDDNNERQVDYHDDTTAVICDCACLYLSAIVCSALGAKRIGNMAILKDRWVETSNKSYISSRYDEETIVVGDDECHSHNSDIISGDDGDGNDTLVEEEYDDDNNEEDKIENDISDHEKNSNLSTKGNTTRHRKVSLKPVSSLPSKPVRRKQSQPPTQKRHVLDLVVGPFWPMLFFVTYPLILGVSFLTAYFAVFIPGQKWFIILAWSTLTFALCFSLFSVSCRDPGIMRRHPEPGSSTDTAWRWNEEALSYRPRDALYDPECACIIEEYDHTCPWTGTAIGKKNMFAFQCFVSLVCVCLIMDVLLLTGTANYDDSK